MVRRRVPGADPRPAHRGARTLIRRSVARVGAGLLALALARAAARTLLGVVVERVEAHLCRVHEPPPYPASARARALHAATPVVDLHADSLLWGRDLARAGRHGHVDVPRLLVGGVTLEVFAAATRISRHIRPTGNDERGDDVRWIALARGWPLATWSSLLARALHLASEADRLATGSNGRFRVVRSVADLDAVLDARAAGQAVVGGLLAIEGAQALDGDAANLQVLADAGYRMLGLSHFYDTPFAGSAHGRTRGGLTPAGRDLVRAAGRRGMVVDVAHASAATILDVADVAGAPIVASHTGVRGTHDSPRNLDDDQLRAIAATGGVVGIGFWPDAVGGRDAGAIVRAIRYAIDVAGPAHVALGSDFDGAVATPFDVTGLPMLTDALLGTGMAEDVVRDVLGGNALRVLRSVLPVR